MEYRVFSISAHGGEEATEELRQFVRAQRVVQVYKHLVTSDGPAYWTMLVEYHPSANGRASASNASRNGRQRVDQRETLNDAEKQCYDRLRELRKAIAETNRHGQLVPAR